MATLTSAVPISTAIIVNYFVDEFKSTASTSPTAISAMQHLRDEAGRPRSSFQPLRRSTSICRFANDADADGPKHFEHKLTRAKLEDLVAELIDKTFAVREGAQRRQTQGE